MKKLVSLLLALSMVFGLTAVTAETVYFESSAQGFGSERSQPPSASPPV